MMAAPSSDTRLITGQAARFVLMGGLNTLLSYVIYWCLLGMVDYRFAYTISYAATILTGFALNTWFVFRARWSWRKLAAFPLIHVVNFGVGITIVWLSTELIGLRAEVGPVIATFAVIPLGFVLTRALLKSPLTR
jgi:putative flippase GtrA